MMENLAISLSLTQCNSLTEFLFIQTVNIKGQVVKWLLLSNATTFVDNRNIKTSWDFTVCVVAADVGIS